VISGQFRAPATPNAPNARSVYILYDASMNLTTELVEIKGVRLETQRIAGPADVAPIVFLHEGLGSVALWTQRGISWPEAVCAATGRGGLVYSRRGYGQSDPVPRVRGEPGESAEPGGRRTGRLLPDYMHREAWDVLPALLEALQISNPVLLGHSDGASIALLHASRHPVAACIAMAPHVLVEDIAVQAIAQATVAFEAGGLRERLARYHADVDVAFWQWNDVWLSPGFRSFDIREDCKRISAPLLLIQGLDDEYGTMRQLDEIALAAPHAQQLRLAACGHSPQRDQAGKTAQAIADFLKTAA
jgi:pimeloyl-ACP methyl ester carboxylesterase